MPHTRMRSYAYEIMRNVGDLNATYAYEVVSE